MPEAERSRRHHSQPARDRDQGSNLAGDRRCLEKIGCRECPESGLRYDGGAFQLEFPAVSLHPFLELIDKESRQWSFARAGNFWRSPGPPPCPTKCCGRCIVRRWTSIPIR